ncbi:TPA: hypothetical protein ACGJZI_005076 [Pseudomonas aeruginosa]|uniref:hypothetical protein n=2 Tax=Pseudomonas aeruginosa TaxID=287 RepID=UPI0005B84A84|nr:hypothetical protein [Pseudomonas aeruginosa]MBW6173078.1 hypothetical protein [Pseudomonas aeruginosa]MDP5451878.1 hypothetical protein [Pseudomonas aeruginosa]MDP5622183.1 hypothetical protein [Pseudomonas aeruginosa]HBO9046388.1 hypothetical protein [Pseudomonas aeruginosa]HBP1071966.1 hypothetical protein [Pseudomonas aeruginosa]
MHRARVTSGWWSEMLRADFDNIERMLWAVRNGRSRADLSFNVGRLYGYMVCLLCHGDIDDAVHKRLDALLMNAQDYAMCVVVDLEWQGWS